VYRPLVFSKTRDSLILEKKGGPTVPDDLARKLSVVLAAVRDGLPTEEICRRYGIERRTYFRWRRGLTRAGLAWLRKQLATQPDADPVVDDLERQKAELEARVLELERSKIIWELRYKLLRWRLENAGDDRVEKILAEINRLLPERTEEGA